jgi:hypothetical protein
VGTLVQFSGGDSGDGLNDLGIAGGVELAHIVAVHDVDRARLPSADQLVGVRSVLVGKESDASATEIQVAVCKGLLVEGSEVVDDCKSTSVQFQLKDAVAVVNATARGIKGSVAAREENGAVGVGSRPPPACQMAPLLPLGVIEKAASSCRVVAL